MQNPGSLRYTQRCLRDDRVSLSAELFEPVRIGQIISECLSGLYGVDYGRFRCPGSQDSHRVYIRRHLFCAQGEYRVPVMDGMGGPDAPRYGILSLGGDAPRLRLREHCVRHYAAYHRIAGEQVSVFRVSPEAVLQK